MNWRLGLVQQDLGPLGRESAKAKRASTKARRISGKVEWVSVRLSRYWATAASSGSPDSETHSLCRYKAAKKELLG